MSELSEDSSKIRLFGPPSWGKWVLLFAIWTVIGLSEAARLYFRYNMTQLIYPWSQTLVWGLADWYLWGLFSLVIVRITARFGYERRKWKRNLAIHLGSAVVIGVVQIFLDAVVGYISDTTFFMEPGEEQFSFWLYYEVFLRGMFQRALLHYFLIAFVAYAIMYYKRYRHEEVQRAGLEGKLAQAQLEALKVQLHPHFLFNTLNAISALIHSDPNAAEKMIVRLSELLRTALDSAGVQEVPLRRELEFLNSYLDIQRIRFQDRLRVQIDVASDLLDTPVPNLLLQPLVENAVKHGISQGTDEGKVRVSARQEGEYLMLEVADNGPGIEDGTSAAEQAGGLGLTNVQERLRQLYGEKHQFALRNGHDGGLVVKVAVPLRKGQPKEMD
jgi:signal transduction histidine kinase